MTLKEQKWNQNNEIQKLFEMMLYLLFKII